MIFLGRLHRPRLHLPHALRARKQAKTMEAKLNFNSSKKLTSNKIVKSLEENFINDEDKKRSFCSNLTSRGGLDR